MTTTRSIIRRDGVAAIPVIEEMAIPDEPSIRLVAALGINAALATCRDPTHRRRLRDLSAYILEKEPIGTAASRAAQLAINDIDCP